MEWELRVTAQRDLDRQLKPYLTARRVHRPLGGWLRTVRKALGMSAAAMAKDLRVLGDTVADGMDSDGAESASHELIEYGFLFRRELLLGRLRVAIVGGIAGTIDGGIDCCRHCIPLEVATSELGPGGLKPRYGCLPVLLVTWCLHRRSIVSLARSALRPSSGGIATDLLCMNTSS
jgi:hypothetical protein